MSPLCRLEYIIEFLLQNRSLGKRPVRIFLMTEDDVFEHGFRDTQQVRYLDIHFRTLC